MFSMGGKFLLSSLLCFCCYSTKSLVFCGSVQVNVYKHHKFPVVVLPVFTATACKALSGAGGLQSRLVMNWV